MYTVGKIINGWKIEEIIELSLQNEVIKTVYKCKCIRCGKNKIFSGYNNMYFKTCDCVIANNKLKKWKDKYEDKILDDIKILNLYYDKKNIIQANVKCMKCGKEYKIAAYYLKNCCKKCNHLHDKIKSKEIKNIVFNGKLYKDLEKLSKKINVDRKIILKYIRNNDMKGLERFRIRKAARLSLKVLRNESCK